MNSPAELPVIMTVFPTRFTVDLHLRLVHQLANAKTAIKIMIKKMMLSRR